MNFLELLDYIKKNEGLRLTPYKCPKGYWTIGYGLNLETSFTKEMAQCLLELKAHSIYSEVVRSCPWFLELNTVRQQVIMDMAYNMGVAGVLTFKKMIRAIIAKDYNRAGKEILDSNYHTDVGKRAELNAMLMMSGVI